jgi:HemY protein
MNIVLRLLFIFIALAFIGALFAFAASRPGEVTLVFSDLRIDTSLAVALSALFLLLLLVLFLDRLLRPLFSGPRRALDAFNARRQKRGERALTRGLLALAVGDEAQAKRESGRALRVLKNAPLSLYLAAQIHLKNRDKTAQQENEKALALCTAMLDDPQTELMGRKGLAELALRRADYETALVQARRALQLHPQSPWAWDCVFTLECRKRNWARARLVLEEAFASGLVSREEARRRRAVLTTAWAQELNQASNAHAAPPGNDASSTTALGLALEAVALAPDLVPASVLAARLLHEQGQTRRAEALLEGAWVQRPHPLLAETYDKIAEDEPQRVRADRLDDLVALYPDHPESKLLAIANALTRHEVETARELRNRLSLPVETARLLMIEAELVRLEQNNEVKARRLFARAASAPREGEWVCARCATPALEWTVLCPACGAFDGVCWRSLLPEEFRAQTPEPLPSLADMLPAARPAALPVPDVLSVPGTSSAKKIADEQMDIELSIPPFADLDRPTKNAMQSPPASASDASMRAPSAHQATLFHQPDDPGPSPARMRNDDDMAAEEESGSDTKSGTAAR